MEGECQCYSPNGCDTVDVGAFDRHALQHKHCYHISVEAAGPCNTESGAATDHTMTLVSMLPVAKRLLSGAQDTQVIFAE
jgi:hypothetical protein